MTWLLRVVAMAAVCAWAGYGSVRSSTAFAQGANDPATNAAQVAEAREAAQKVDDLISDIKRLGLPVPPTLLAAASRLNLAVSLGTDIGQAAGQADYEVRQIYANKYRLCAGDPDSPAACEAKVNHVWQARNVNAVLNWDNKGSVVRRVASMWADRIKNAIMPGGISLSRAAAAQMALDLDLSGLVVDDGRMILAGRSNAGVKIDAGLFMTAMRLACEQVDPYFSLDPDDGAKWQEEGGKASTDIWKLVQQDLGLNAPEWWRNIPDGVNFKAFSAKRNYPQAWPGIVARYPHFKTRLVFKPEWLRETRYGEILYIGDIMLKELSSGLSIVNSKDQRVRALAVSNYRSARFTSVAESLLASVDGGQLKSHGVTGARYWFDLVPSARAQMSSMLDDEIKLNTPYEPKSALGRALDANLKSLGAREALKPSELLRYVSRSQNAIDLSHVYPTMFIIGHDHVRHEDVKANDRHELIVSDAINRNMKDYVAAYSELRDLTDAFRAYIAAIAVVKKSDKACPAIQNQPLLRGEMPRKVMPTYHQSELTFTVASFRHADASGRKTAWWSNSNFYYGGVSPAGRELYSKAQSSPTQLIQTIQSEADFGQNQEKWTGRSGNQYYALVLTDPDEQALGSMPTTGRIESKTSVREPPRPTSPPDAPKKGMLDDIEENRTGVQKIK